MKKPRGIVICVGYDDLLDITLRKNMRHLSECCVVTSLDDERTVAIAESVPGVSVFRTDAFTRHGASFNKGLAMEEGLTFFGREVGPILIWDADIIFPDEMDLSFAQNGLLYGASRRIINDPQSYVEGFEYSNLKIERESEFAGFFQFFFPNDVHLEGKEYWYDPTFSHAGGGDSYFQSLWPIAAKVRLPIVCLHLGPRDTNWFGRVSKRKDGSIPDGWIEKKMLMVKLMVSQGWSKVTKKISLKDRVKVPGYESKFIWGRSNPETDVIDGAK
jgi:hypothetical protein